MVTDLYISLIYKELDGSITADERRQLEDWIKDPANAQTRAQIHSVWQLSEGVDAPVQVNLDKEFVLLQSKMKKESKVVAMPKRSRSWLSIAAGVAILIAGIIGVQRISQTSSELVSHTATTTNQYYMLEDGSEIYLQKGSTISYNQPLDRNRRWINLDGEAVFHVAHDKDWPLDVKTTNETITVLGTKFHVNETDLSTSIQLIEGKIAVKNVSGQAITELTKGQSLDRNHETGNDEVRSELNQNSFGWQTKSLKFQNSRLVDVATDLARVYGKSIIIDDANTENCRLSGSFKDKTLDQIMSTISEVHGIEITADGDTFHWKGGTCD